MTISTETKYLLELSEKEWDALVDVLANSSSAFSINFLSSMKEHQKKLEEYNANRRNG